MTPTGSFRIFFRPAFPHTIGGLRVRRLAALTALLMVTSTVAVAGGAMGEETVTDALSVSSSQTQNVPEDVEVATAKAYTLSLDDTDNYVSAFADYEPSTPLTGTGCDKPSDLDMYLYDGGGNLIEEERRCDGGLTGIWEEDLSPGQYTVVVRAEWGVTHDYDFDLELKDGTDYREFHDGGVIFVGAFGAADVHVQVPGEPCVSECNPVPAPSSLVCVSVSQDVSCDLVAVSVSGNSKTCRSEVAISGEGDVCGRVVAVSGTGWAGSFGLAVSGTGPAVAVGGAAISGTGDATTQELCALDLPCLHGPAVSGTGDASGEVAVSGTGQADGDTAEVSGCELAGLCYDPDPAPASSEDRTAHATVQTLLETALPE